MGFYFYKPLSFFNLVVLLVLCNLIADKAQAQEDMQTEDVESVEGAYMDKIQKMKITKVPDLVYLVPFSDISVIQRRFMPKTGRISFSTSAVFIFRNEFFLNPGGEIHISYNFLEKHSLELSAYWTAFYRRQVTTDFESPILGRFKVDAENSLAVAGAFAGLTYKWMPIYGKVALFNRSILAFDTFFNIGGGLSQIYIKTRKLDLWVPTVVLGVGQVFAITRDLGLRWDLRVHASLAKVNNKNTMLYDYAFGLGFIYYYPSMRLKR